MQLNALREWLHPIRLADLPAIVLGVILAAAVAAFFTGCGTIEQAWPEPHLEAAVCVIPETNVRTDALACEALQAHERIAAPAFARLVTPAAGDVSGWTVRVRRDVKWSEKHRRLYFTDAAALGWEIWGLTDKDAGAIELADTNLGTGILAHEQCHVRYPPPRWTHAEWKQLGCDQVENEVRKALTPAEGELVDELELVPVSLPDGRVAHGVLAI